MRILFLLLVIFLAPVVFFNANGQSMIYIPGSTVYVSNVTNQNSGLAPFGADRWLAQSFQTGKAPNGYTLTTFVAAVGGASGITASVYTDDHDVPGMTLGKVGMTLLPSTTYWIVFTDPSSSVPTTDSWGYTSDSSFYSDDGWLVGASTATSENGINWTSSNTQPVFKIGIEGAPVPEPSTCALALFGAALFVLRRQTKMSKVIAILSNHIAMFEYFSLDTCKIAL